MEAGAADSGLDFVVVGAGAVGGFVGALLRRAGFRVSFLVRETERSRVQREVLLRSGLTVLCSAETDFREILTAREVGVLFSTDPSCLQRCSRVLVATKRTESAAVHRQLAEQGVRCPVVFLQNGLWLCEGLERAAYEAIECVVQFNAVLDAEAGAIALAEPLKDAMLVLDGHCPSAPSVAADLSRLPISVKVTHAFQSVQCGKLLLNMTNAVNALSGLALAPMMMQGPYRLVLAASISEARAVFAAAGLEPKAARPRDDFLLRWFEGVLRAPQWIFAAALGRKLRGRNSGSTSMAQDLAARRVPTEVDFLNGEVVRLGRRHGVPTPVNKRLVELVKAAEVANAGCPGIPGAALAQAVGLPPGDGRELQATAAAAGGLGVAALLGGLLAQALRACP